MCNTQGKCVSCRKRYVWERPPLLRNAYCPDCGQPLYQTTYLLKWPIGRWPAESGEAHETRARH